MITTYLLIFFKVAGSGGVDEYRRLALERKVELKPIG
jgi:hypothetical protein